MMFTDIHRFISSCSTSAQAKVPCMLPVSKLMLWVRWQNSYSIHFICRFSNSLHLIPLPSLPTSFRTVALVFNHVFSYFGIPEDILIELTQFTSTVWVSYMEKLGVMVSLTSGINPQSNREVERAHQDTQKICTSQSVHLRHCCFSG